MYADLYKYLSSESADGVGEYVVYWLAVVATVGGGAFVAATQRYFRKLCGNFHLLLQFWNLYLI